MSLFQFDSPMQPLGDQPEAIRKLTEGIASGRKHQTLLGVTGSGKTYTMARVIEKINRPTLVISHNKTLAAQLYQEFKEFFPNNSVHYFVSYYDYYQPEAYMPHNDTYIEKDAQINEEIDKLRHAATQTLLTRDDVIIVASVSCIYNLGSPDEYKEMSIELHETQKLTQAELVKYLQALQYRREYELTRSAYRTTRDEVEVLSADGSTLTKIKFKKNTIDRISIAEVDSEKLEFERPHYNRVLSTNLFPAKYWISSKDSLRFALHNIKSELAQHVKTLKKEQKFVEADRLTGKTLYDLEMIRQTGYCHGIENYSRHLDFRKAGEPPFTLIDFFRTKKNFFTIIDESHITVPQLRGMHNGDKARKTTLIKHGFRLPSALDNRPLMFKEFEKIIQDVVYVSATPGEYEMKKSTKKGLTEQLIRPTGLLDPTIEIFPTEKQIDNLLERMRQRIARRERTLITTLTKRMAEDLSEFLADNGIKVNYLHSDIKTLERIEIIKDLRTGVYDAIVGVNLLREGLDLPEVSLIAIFDADKEGFLRNTTTLIQTMGRAARNMNGHVVLYADKTTRSMHAAIEETERRRKTQEAFNTRHGITPQTIKKEIKSSGLPAQQKKKRSVYERENILDEDLHGIHAEKAIEILQKEMERAARKFNFEKALLIRAKIQQLRQENKK